MAPSTEDLGTRVGVLEAAVADVRGDIHDMRKDVAELRKDFANRLPGWGTTVISLLALACGGLLGALVTFVTVTN